MTFSLPSTSCLLKLPIVKTPQLEGMTKTTIEEGMGVARIFQRGGGVTLCQSEGIHQVVTMAKVSSWNFHHLV